MKKGKLFVLSGPSGVGKTTIRKEIPSLLPDIHISVSCTTRRQREKEVEGRDYFFVTIEKFEDMLSKGQLLEWANVHGNMYGTPLEPIEKALGSGKNSLLVIDVHGAAQVRDTKPESVLIFLMPPSMDELKRRLMGRNTESEESIKIRLDNAAHEIELSLKYDYKVVNSDIGEATAKIVDIITGKHITGV
jgi:guanylate kinase